MSSVQDQSYPFRHLKPSGLDAPPTYRPFVAPQYVPQPQVPVMRELEPNYYINTLHPNPFTVKPIATDWKTNELIMRDPLLRVAARTAMLDITLKQDSNFVSPQHLCPGWKWCGGSACSMPGCSVQFTGSPRA